MSSRSALLCASSLPPLFTSMLEAEAVTLIKEVIIDTICNSFCNKKDGVRGWSLVSSRSALSCASSLHLDVGGGGGLRFNKEGEYRSNMKHISQQKDWCTWLEPCALSICA